MPNGKYKNSTRLTVDQLLKINSLNYTAEASDLEWAPGFFPLKIDVKIGDCTYTFWRQVQYEDKVAYECGERLLLILND